MAKRKSTIMDNSYISINNWNIQKTIVLLFILILPIFEKIFGKDVMRNEPCLVYVDKACTTAPITLQNPKRIILSSSSTCPCALIFELAHELSHYAIMQRMNNQYGNTCAVAAFEEPACEAMSLYVLKLCSEKQDIILESICDCHLFPEKNKLYLNLENYRVRLYKNVNTTDLCATYEEWTSINEGFTGNLSSNNQRPDVRAMRNHLYNSFLQMPEEIANFIDYPLYLRSFPFDKLIDISKWEVDRPQSAAFIKKMCAIQPVVV